MTTPAAKLRVDKWLWQARFFKTRTKASEVVSSGGLRINGSLSAKPAAIVGPGDVLTFSQGDHIRVIRVLSIGTRRGPATEAQTLYDDLSVKDTEIRNNISANPGFDGKGRPTKRDRRQLDLSRARHLE